MPTVRGFVQRIEVGRAGLATVSLVHADGSAGQYVISDLDADPERFNERLSKLGVLRDAMSRAEPVELEHVEGKAGREIDRAARISRDDLRPVSRLEQLTGLVLEVAVAARNGANAAGELHDTATVGLLTTGLEVRELVLDLQAPERLVVDAQLAMLRDAHADGRLVRLLVDAASAGGVGGVTDGTSNTLDVGEGGGRARIVVVAVDGGGDLFGGEEARDVSGFVESLSLLRIPGVPASSSVGTFAHVRLTTAPPFTGAGNVVAMAPFTPETLDLLTPRGSLAYDLFEAALRDTLRVRAGVVFVGGGREPKEERPPTEPQPRQPERPVVRAMNGGGASERAAARAASEGAEEGGDPGAGGAAARTEAGPAGEERAGLAALLRRGPQGMSAGAAGRDADAAAGSPGGRIGVAVGVELLAPCASASRPVWVAIERRQLDHGPEADLCALASPSSDLAPRTMRDLRLPYPARWCGHGCFTGGVYRFQIQLPSPFTVTVDGTEICLHDAEGAGGVRIGHACIEAGCHEVCVAIEAWTCETDFVMDVYRLR